MAVVLSVYLEYESRYIVKGVDLFRLPVDCRQV